MSEHQPVADQGAVLLALYDRAVPEVYGYLLPAAAASRWPRISPPRPSGRRRRREAPHGAPLTIAWLVGVARHKLVDHWRRQGREERNLRLVHDEATPAEDPWDEHLDASRAHAVLEKLGPHHRAALTLRYSTACPSPRWLTTRAGRTPPRPSSCGPASPSAALRRRWR